MPSPSNHNADDMAAEPLHAHSAQAVAADEDLHNDSPERQTPQGVDDRIARYLTRVLAWTGILIFLVSVPLVLIYSPDQPFRLVLSSIAGASGAAAFWLMRMGHVRLAAYGLLWTNWGVICCGTLFNGGVGAPGLSATIVMTVFATLAIGIRHALLMCAVTAVLCVGLIYAEHHGRAVVPVSPELRAVFYIVLSVMTARMLWTTTSMLHNAVSRAHAESVRRAEVVAQLRSSQAELRKLNAELEQRVSERTAQLSATNEELQAFSHSVAHDLRAPLRAINGFSTEVLTDCQPLLPEQSRNDLLRIRAASQAMDVLIDGLLRLSRLTRQDLHHQRVDLSALAEEIIATLRQVDPARAVEIRITPGLTAFGDLQLLRVLLDNLLGNAWKYSEHTAAATISFVAEQHGDETAFAVHDNGAGFDMAYASKLFGAFQRLHSPGQFAGTGIGLATVRRIVTRHGGRIWAHAAVDRGASFWFTLAARAVPEDHTAKAE
jgi:signal transduction histidine kinase